MNIRDEIIDGMWSILACTGYSAQGKRAITTKVITLFRSIMRRQKKIESSQTVKQQHKVSKPQK